MKTYKQSIPIITKSLKIEPESLIRISFAATKSFHKKLNQAASKLNINKSILIRSLITNFIDEQLE